MQDCRSAQKKDIFRKIDLVLNRTLDAGELNQFGDITDIDLFKNVTDEDFEDGQFANIATTEDGVTQYGF